MCRLWPALALVSCLALAPPALPQDIAPARVPCQGVHAVSEKAYHAWLERMKKESFRPTHVSVYGVNAKQFAAVAIKDGKSYPWEARLGLTEPQYRKACDDLNKTGYRVVSVSVYYENKATRFAALWVKDGHGWVAHHGMTGADYGKTCDELRKKGFRVISVSGYSETNNVTHFAAVWVADKTTTWLERHDLSELQYRQAYDELRPKGYRPVSISFYYTPKGSPQYAVVFAQGAKDYWEARHNLTQAEYQAEFERWVKNGGRPMLVCGCTYEKTNTYAAVFVGDAASHDALVGKWDPVMKWDPIKKSGWPVVAIHAALLSNGKVLMWPRLENDDKGDGKTKRPTLPRPKEESYPHLWDPDPEHPDPKHPDNFTMTSRPPYNLFCSGHAFLPDGRLLIAGGHRYSNYWGDDKTTIYNPINDTWAKDLPPMKLPRWYPSCVTLPSGDILVDGGSYWNPVKVNRVPEVWAHNWKWNGYGEPGPWRYLTGVLDEANDDNFPRIVPFYPFLHVAPNGSVFSAGPNARTGYIVPTGKGAWQPVGDHVSKLERDYGSSVMYEPGMVLVVGGGWVPTNTAEIINLNITDKNKNPHWSSTQSMGDSRRHMNATLLADGTLFASGGTSTTGFNEASGGVLNTEVWDPATGHWTPMAAQAEIRIYHSIALLLPNGKVLSAGGGEPGGGGKFRGAYDGDHKSAQVYSPPYLFRGPQPVITSAPVSVKYGQKFEVKTPDAPHIPKARHVTWIRLGSATHARNFDQRINYLDYTPGGGSLSVTAPSNANLAPPGHYMLFILNDKGVPSKANIVHIS